MSVVVVKKFPDRIDIGADSQTTYGTRKYIANANIKPDEEPRDCKLVRLEEDFIIGHVGWSRNLYFMLNFLSTAKPADESHGAFTALYQDFLAYGASMVGNGKISTVAQSDFLVVYGSSVFLLSEYHAEEIDDHYAIGSGSSYAVGVLHALPNHGQAVYLALEAACQYDLYCHDPVTIHSVDLE